MHFMKIVNILTFIFMLWALLLVYHNTYLSRKYFKILISHLNQS